MTFEKKLKTRIVEAQKKATLAQEEIMDKLLDNKEFIETQRSISRKEAELKELNTTLKQLNKIKPFVSSDGHKYNVNTYPVNFFGTGLGEVLGVIQGSRSAFTDELALEYAAITGLSMIELREAQEALGSPAYMSKDGEIQEALPSNRSKLVPLVKSVMLKMNINEFNTDSLTQDKLDLWFAKAELAADKKKKDFNKSLALDASTNFTMED